MAPVASTGEALVWFEHRPGTHDAMGRWVEELVLSRLSAEGTFGPALAVVADGRSTEWFGASDDGATNVLCSRGKERYTAEVRRGGETFSFEYERNGRVNALSPDGSRLLVEESDDCALYDTTNGRVVARIPSDIRWAAFDGAQRLCYQTYIDGDESEKMVVCLVDPDGTSNELTDLPPSRTIPDDVARLVRDASGEGTIAFSRSGARKVKVDGTLAPVSASGVAGWSGDLVVAGGWTVSVERRKL